MKKTKIPAWIAALKVGDPVFIPGTDRSRVRSQTKKVTKIGRVYITVGEDWNATRFYKETGETADYPVVLVMPSEEAHDAYMARRRKVEEVLRAFSGNMPYFQAWRIIHTNINDEQLATLVAMLESWGINIDDE